MKMNTSGKAHKIGSEVLNRVQANWHYIFFIFIYILSFIASPGFSASSDLADTADFEQTYPGYVKLSFPLPDDCYNPTGLAWDGEYLWLCDKYGMIYKIHPTDGLIIDSISSLGITLTGLAWDETTQTLLCTEADSGSIYRINPDDGSVKHVFSTIDFSNLQGVAHDGSWAIFYLDKQQGKIVKIDATTYEKIKDIPVPNLNLRGLTWDGRYLWAAENDEDKIFLIDPEKGLVISSILSPASDPFGLTFDKSERILWHVDCTEKRIYRILVRNTDVSYTKDSPFGARIQYIDEVRNKGPNNLSYLQTFIAIPQTTLHQTLITPITYDFLHSFDDNLYDIYGQQVAYDKEPLNVGSTTSPSYDAEIINFNLRYFLYPEDVGDETFPQDIRDLYITKTFPLESDKYDIDYPVIQDAAQEAITGASNLYWKYRQINDYVVNHLFYNSDGKHDDAPVVLQNGHGSCSEYTYLFIALCRAAGIPARYQGGSRPRDDLPYTDDVFHRWAEAYFPNIGWVPIDPTWNDTRTEEPKIIAPYFGTLINKLLVTTTGGGYSTGPDPENGLSTVRYLKWNYNCYNTWSPSSDVDIIRRCMWNAPSERRLVCITITPFNPVVRLEKGAEKLTVTGYYNDESIDDITDEVIWESSDNQVGIVNHQGYFMTVEAGTTMVTAIHGDTGIKDEIKVVVTAYTLNQPNLTITASNGGTTEPAPGNYTYDSGTEVSIRAIPDAQYIFTGWSGSVPQGHENNNPLSITMDSHKSITANFVRQYTLTIASGTGGTTEPSAGSYTYDSGTEVSIRAIPDTQYIFTGWSGNVPSYQTNSNPIEILLDSDKSIQANFATKGDGSLGKKEGCFIATAACGSPLHPYVRILRDFRDTYLMPRKIGRVLVDVYYKYSPFVAGLISKHKALKVAVRISLLPLVVFSYSMLHFSPTITTVLGGFILVIPIFFVWFYRRRMKAIE